MSSRRSHALPALAFAGSTAIWGSTFLAISFGNDTVPAIWAASLRLGLATLILGSILALTGQGWPRGAALRAAAGYGFLVLGLNFALLYWGQKTVPSGITSVFYATIPLTTAIVARAIGLERLTKQKIGGALLALVGVGIIFSGELADTSAETLPMLAIWAGATLAAIGGVVLKRGPRQSAIGANAVGSGVGCAVCLVVSLLAGEPHPVPRVFAEWFPILYLTLAGSVGAFVLYAWLLKHWSASRTSLSSVIVPVVAVILGALVRHERLSGSSFAGALLVLAGVWVSFRGRRKEPAQ